MRKWIFAALFAVLAGCSSTGTQSPAPVEEKGAPAAATPGTSTSGTQSTGVTGTATQLPPHKQPNNILAQQRSVYFDFDEYTIKDQYRPMIEAHAKYLQANPSLHVTLQGNTDERGTREYNIALGQRRADSVKQMMVLLGAKPDQIETVSFGKEKPRREGHDETAWAENRRVDIVYAGE
jgi:peptidoglycan-associated lipoprotein